MNKKITIRRLPFFTQLSLLCCLNNSSSTSPTSLLSGFRNRFMPNPFCSVAPIILIPIFLIVWIVEFTRPNSWHTSTFFFFSIFYLSYQFDFSFDTQGLLFVTVATLALYQSAVDCSRTNVKGNFKLQSELLLLLSFPGLELICSYVKVLRERGLSRTRKWLNSPNNTLLGKLYWNRWPAVSLYSR